MKTLVVIPALNEAENIASVIAAIDALRRPLDVVVVDDGSTDATAALAERAGARVLRLPCNLGYGAAVQTGLRYAVASGYDACVLSDGDGQHDPASLPALLAPVTAGETDLAIGSRFLGRAEYHIPLARRLGMLLFGRLTSLIVGQRITDPTSGFQAMSAPLAAFFAGDHYPSDFPDADTLIRVHLAGFRIREVPATIRPRLRGQSMHTGTTALYYASKMLFSIFIVLTQRRMLREEMTHAARHETPARPGQPGRDADDRAARPAATPR